MMETDKKLKQEIRDKWANNQGYTTMVDLLSDNELLEPSIKIFTLEEVNDFIDLTIQKLNETKDKEIKAWKETSLKFLETENKLHNKKIKDLQKTHQADTNKLIEALKKIENPEGAYSRDPLTFCENTIDNVKELARKALREAEKKC